MEEIVVNKSTKKNIWEVISSRPDFLGFYSDYDGIVTFLNKIWPLQDMPSLDGRYSNAFDDAQQHLVNNSDWDLNYTFIERFQLIEGDNVHYNKFLETVVSPDTRKNKDEIMLYVRLINSQLDSIGLRMILVDYFEELPVYRIGYPGESDDLPIEIQPNKIPFFRGIENIDEYPCFVLHYDNWNDYSIKTLMQLQYFSEPYKGTDLLNVKIMRRGAVKTWDELTPKFTSLARDFCSCGLDSEYYFFLKGLLPLEYQSVLLGIRDVGLFPRIAEEFENDPTFKTSLIRDNTNERMLRTIRFDLNDIDYSQAFKFNFSYKPPYAENELLLNFDFQFEGELQHRVFGLIGKNGTGKTRILSAIANSLSMELPLNITPKKPLYGKIFTISYSFFDRVEFPLPTASFNYVYCGLKKREGGWLSEDELIDRFHKSATKITEKGEVDNWRVLLDIFIPKDILGAIFFRDWFGSYNFVPEHFSQLYTKVSSGQSILIFIITEIIAQVRYNSLILYDEPETHLHPNAISELMNLVFELVRRYDSFCIIATHSPLIIQELQSRNIYVIERDGNFTSSRKLEKEPFGENLTVITDEIFGNRQIERHYITVLNRLVNSGKGFDEIVELIETNDVPLSLNARLYIKALVAERNEKH